MKVKDKRAEYPLVESIWRTGGTFFKVYNMGTWYCVVGQHSPNFKRPSVNFDGSGLDELPYDTKGDVYEDMQEKGLHKCRWDDLPKKWR